MGCSFLISISFSVNFHTVICYHWLLKVNHLNIFFLCVLGGYFDDDLTILCGNALSQFQFLWGHWVHHFCLEISFHCFVNLESVIFLTAFCGNFYNFWALLAWVWLLSTESHMSLVCQWWPWKFCFVENFPMASEDDKIDLSSVAVTDLQKS